jgi:hypothetical protein
MIKISPVTTPVLVNQFHGVPIYPPLHPYEKQFKNPQQAVVSATDRGVLNPDLIHNRSSFKKMYN